MANYLLFAFNATRYAIATEAVRTTFWLPQPSPVVGLPDYFVGLIDLHGKVLPIIDLDQRFGHPGRPYQLQQAVILLQQDQCRVGLVADQVEDLVDVGPDAIAPYVQLEGEPDQGGTHIIAGTLRWQDGVLILLDAIALLRAVPLLSEQPPPEQLVDRFSHLSLPELALLRQRTHQLARPPALPDHTGELYALVRIAAGRYAIALGQVAEFTHLGPCTAIPCCPPHIIGCVNLRGAILTVLDLAPLLQGNALRDYQDMVVLRLGDWRLGLGVHQILDIRAVAAAALTPLTGQAYGHPHCKWMLQDDDGVAGVLDLEALRNQGLFDVNDQV